MTDGPNRTAPSDVPLADLLVWVRDLERMLDQLERELEKTRLMLAASLVVLGVVIMVLQ